MDPLAEDICIELKLTEQERNVFLNLVELEGKITEQYRDGQPSEELEQLCAAQAEAFNNINVARAWAIYKQKKQQS